VLELAYITSALGGALCGVLGFYVVRLGLTTLTFTIAHAALAGAALALVLGTDMTYTAMVLAITTSLVLGLIFSRVEYLRDTICMTFFSFFSALALLSIYLSNTLVLATATLSTVLWGSVLAVTIDKAVLLTSIALILTVYLLAFKTQISSLIFDKRLAEAEGLNVLMHTVIIMLITATSISIMLRVVGGFLVFTLIYIPTMASTVLTARANKQLLTAALIGALAGPTGLTISLVMDLPVGVSITLTAVAMASATMIVKGISLKHEVKKVKLTQ